VVADVRHEKERQMNLLFTRWLYPLREAIPLSDAPRFVLDNPRGDEIAEVAELLDESYHRELEGFFPPTAEPEYISIHWMISQFISRFAPADPYVAEVLGDHRSDSVFESLAKLWIVARYDDEGVKKELQQSAEQMRKDGQLGFFLLEDDNPIIRNSTRLRNYLSLVSLLVHSEGDGFFGNPILISSNDFPMPGRPFDEHLFRNAIIMLLVFSTSEHEKTKTDKLAWAAFPYVRDRLLEMRDALNTSAADGHGELLMYVGNILRVVEHDARDVRVRFTLLVSLLELLLTHNPDSSRYNVEDSISRQFRFKTGVMVHRQYPDTDLPALERRLKQIYGLRSAVAHGDFKALAKYEANLCKKDGKEEYMDDLVTDAYFYLRATLEQFLQDPEFVLFIKRS